MDPLGIVFEAPKSNSFLHRCLSTRMDHLSYNILVPSRKRPIEEF